MKLGHATYCSMPEFGFKAKRRPDVSDGGAIGSSPANRVPGKLRSACSRQVPSTEFLLDRPRSGGYSSLNTFARL